MKFHPKPRVSTDLSSEQHRRSPAGEPQLTAAMHLSALMVMVVLFITMLGIRGC